MDEVIFPDNNERVTLQKGLEIQVIIGNPPYSVGQESENDNNTNLTYPTLDSSIRDTYAAASAAGLKRNLYDSYVRSYRWASDRVKDQGVIAFVSNGSFIDKGFADGFRKTLGERVLRAYTSSTFGETSARTSGADVTQRGAARSSGKAAGAHRDHAASQESHSTWARARCAIMTSAIV